MSSIEPDTPPAGTPEIFEDNNIQSDGVSIKEEDKESEERTVDLAKVASNFQEKAKNYLIEQSGAVVIPSFSKWFDMNEIHSIEKKSFPDFFPIKEDAPRSVYKTEKNYRDMRDFMINTYRINPIEYLTITAVRRSLAGDVTSIIRIHQFLEKWGLINYQIDPRTKSSLAGPQYTGHFQVTLDTPKGLVPFIPEHKEVINNGELPSPPNSVEPESEKDNNDAEEKNVNEIPLNLEVRRNIYSDSNDYGKANTNILQFFCNVCGKDSTNVRYHNLKNKLYNNNPNSTINNASSVCTNCYEQGLFPSNFQSSDFVKLQASKSDVWSEQEVLLLLEGIEIYGTHDPNSKATNSSTISSNANGQWDKISEVVGTKTKEQCLHKFIQLPIEDRYLHKLINKEYQKSDSIEKDSLIQDVVKEVISKQEGKDLMKKNATENLQRQVTEQGHLINQVIELTLKKVNLKLQNVQTLEASLVKSENQLNLERKQILIERWLNFEKINNLKKQKPELAADLDSLLEPVTINEINKSLINLKVTSHEQEHNGSKKEEEDSESKAAEEKSNLPLSVTKPRSYQFWSG